MKMTVPNVKKFWKNWNKSTEKPICLVLILLKLLALKQHKSMKLLIYRHYFTSGWFSFTLSHSVFTTKKNLCRKQVPMLYDGDLHQHDKILTWLTSQDVFEIKNEIEEVNRKMLDKLLEENEFLTVYFCKLI